MKKDNHRAEQTDDGATQKVQSDRSTPAGSNVAPKGEGGNGADRDTSSSRASGAAQGTPPSASEPTPADVPPAPSPAKASRAGTVLASLSLIVVIAVVAVGYTVWSQGEEQRRQLVNQVEQVRSSTDAAHSSIGTIQNDLGSLRASVESLKASVNSPSNTAAALAKRVADNEKGIADSRQAVISVRDALGALNTNVQSLQGSLKSLSSQIGAVDGKLTSQLNSAVGGLQGTQQSLQEMQKALQKSVDALHDQVNKRADRWMADDAEYLIRVANQRLQLAQDTRTAAAALEGAEQRLRDMGDPSLLDVRKKIADDIVALRAVPDPDITGMALTLSDLAKRVDTLPVAGTNPESVAAQMEKNHTGAQAQTGGWKGFVDRLWAQLKTLVVVRHTGGSSEALLPPDQRFFLRQNLKLDLAAARLALLRGDDKAFHDSLDTGNRWLSQYFNRQSAAVSGMQESLKKLSVVELVPKLPDLSDTLKALRDWQAAHLNKSAALDRGRLGIGRRGAPGDGAVNDGGSREVVVVTADHRVTPAGRG